MTFAGTDQLGVYTVTPMLDPAPRRPRRPEPAAAPPSARPTQPASAGAGASASPPPPDDPLAPVHFAVDLFDVDEIDHRARIRRIHRGPRHDAGRRTGARRKWRARTGRDRRPTTRDELWVPLVLFVLGVLCLEWALYHRDAVLRIRRALGTRLRRDAGGTA